MAKKLDLTSVNENPAVLREYQADILKSMFGFAESLAMKAALELRIPDIMHSNGKPMSLPQIASKMQLSSIIDMTLFSHLMYLLVRKNYFTVHYRSDSTLEPLYGLTPKSQLLVSDHEMSLAPMFRLITSTVVASPWNELGQCIKEGGGLAFVKVHGEPIWEKGSKDMGFNKLFNDAMASLNQVDMKNILATYEHGFGEIEGTLVDVGGGIGQCIAAIVRAHPHLRCINFDLPHVVATAPNYPNVTHVGGDMFTHIPSANAILMKSIMHDWGDEECVKILKNCHKAVVEKSGKVIIIDMVLQPEGRGPWEDIKACTNLEVALNTGGKERTEQEWNNLLKQANFGGYKITNMPFLVSIIEAYP